MIDVALAEISERKSGVDLLVLPFFQGEKKPEAAFSKPPLSPYLRSALDAGDFTGKEQEMLFLYPHDGKDKRVVLLGLGEKEACDAEILRLAGAALAKAARAKKAATLHLVLPEKSAAAPLLEGILLGSYRFELKGGKKDKSVALQKVYLAGADKNFLKEAKKICTVIDSVNWTRDLVNGNADDITSERLVHEAKGLARHSSIKVRVLDKKQIEKEQLGLILAVNRAAVRDPALIILEYKGKPSSTDLTGFVGKGVTFDTGGLNLKSAGMETMKGDMAGAAAVLGLFKAVAALQLHVNLVAILPIVENAIGSKSYKPGDVYVSHSGKTVEITNTDAEGRLILADGLSYLQTHFKPSRIIDIGTLTGGMVVALGEEAAGFYTNDDAMAQAIFSSGVRTGDHAWRMPLYRGYTEMMRSKIADLKNSASRKGGPCTCAAFLQEFVQKKGSKTTPWAHIDIAPTGFLDDPKGLHPTPGTGAGVRLLLDFLMAKLSP